jgi:NitT/TauT family transport system permease protein
MATDETLPDGSAVALSSSASALEPQLDSDHPTPRTRKPLTRRLIGNGPVLLGQLAILAAILAAWQFLPEIGALRSASSVFNPFFVSSPQRVFEELVDLASGSHGAPSVWPYLWQTVKSTILGLAIGVALGASVGLLLSNSPAARRVLSPFIVVLNATPRIALIPIFVIIAGPTTTASVLTAVAVVFFLVFYNAYSGGLAVPREVLQNARLLGASRIELMRTVRLPYVLVWTFASLPNAISFGLVAVVTAELLTGQLGMGSLLESSISSVDATLTFAVVVILAAAGVIAVTAAEAARKRALHWWEIGAE